MRDRKLGKLFERFRRRGDVPALGAVFDATAPELVRVAMSLVHDPVEADDLIQATYLTAIERADAWDGSRRLVPWLLGILVNHAHDLRRKRGRDVDPERLHQREADDPIEAAASVEASESLARAIAGLPARYREVLDPFVREGKRPAEIAAEIGRAPGTVRMQIHRGLDLLRRALPAGIALGALVVHAGPGLGAVRERVMGHAAAKASTFAAAGTAAATTVLGGFTMAKKATLAAITLGLVSTLVYVSELDGGTEEDSLATPIRGVATPEEGELAAGSAPTDVAPPTPAQPTTATPRIEDRTEVETSYERALVGVVGRVVEEDGTPVEGIDVALHEFGFESMEIAIFDASSGSSAPPGLTLGRTRTAADGTFRLGGARANALHGIGVDEGGERPTIRIVDEPLSPGGMTDIGDIVLSAVAPVRGRVVDSKNEPVAGARVRAATLPQGITWLDFADARAETPVYVQQSILATVLELPAWAREIEAILPTATTTTGTDGVFELPGAPAGEIRVLVDRPGSVPALRVVKPGDGPRDLGDVRLESGVARSGRVVTTDGGPVAGIDVRLGRLFDTRFGGPKLALLSSAGTTDAEGRFVLTGTNADDEPVYAARRSSAHPWVVGKPEGEGDVVVTLSPEYSVPIEITDPSGMPIAAEEIVVLRPSPLSGLSYGKLLDPRRPFGRLETVAAGSYVVHGLQKGNYVVRARADGWAVGETRIRARANARPVELELGPARTVEVRVVADATGRPVSRTSVTLMEDPKKLRGFAAGVTDAAGEARLEGIPQELPEGAYLRVEHSLYATRNVPLDGIPEADDGSLEIRLEEGGSFLAHVRMEGEPPPGAISIEVHPSGGSIYRNHRSKHFGLSDPEGDVHVSHLPPGEWTYLAFYRYLDGDVFGLLSGAVRPFLIEIGTVTIEPGQTTEVDIGITRQSAAFVDHEGTASVEGKITLDGEPIDGLRLWITVSGDRPQGTRMRDIGSDGTFYVGELPAGRVDFQVMQERESEGFVNIIGYYNTSFDIADGEAKVLDLEWRSTQLEVEVIDDRGNAVTDTWVSFIGRDEATSSLTTGESTDDLGFVRMRMRDEGAYRVRCSHPELGQAQQDVVVVEGEAESVRLVLDRGVPFGGRVEFPETGGSGGMLRQIFSPYLQLNQRDGELYKHVYLAPEEGRAEFTGVGLPPGAYTARLLGSTTQYAPIDFELPEGGDTGLDFVFEPQESDD